MQIMLKALLLILPLSLAACQALNPPESGEMPAVAPPPVAAADAGPTTQPSPTSADGPASAAEGQALRELAGEGAGEASAEAGADEPAMREAEVAPIQPLPLPEPAPLRTYTIEEGDSYWKIAEKVYGDPMRMQDIADANPEVDPMRLQVGEVIVLPE